MAPKTHQADKQQSNTRARNAQASREAAIIAAATELFAELGFHGSSTKQIAKAAGVSEGTLFNYFDNKNQLLEAVVKRFYLDLAESAQLGLDDISDSHQRFVFLAQNHIRTISANNFLLMRLLAVYFSEHFNFYLDYRDSSIFKHSKSYTKIFDFVIREAIARKELKADLHLSSSRDLFFGSLEYGVRSLLAQGKATKKDFDRYALQLCQPVWQSMLIEKTNQDKKQRKASQQIPALGHDPEAILQRLEAVASRLEEAAS